jgi:hypothetical protein
MTTIPLTDQIDCVKREIAMRERVYPTRVSGRRMTQEQMDRELGRMRAVLRTLQALQSELIGKKNPDPLSQALNENDGVYRP